MVSQTSAAPVNGGAAALASPGPHDPREIARRGINTASDLVRFGTGMMSAALNPESGISIKEGNLAIRAGNFTIRSAEFRRRNGEELSAPQSEEAIVAAQNEAILAREAELTAELERLRSQRAAG